MLSMARQTETQRDAKHLWELSDCERWCDLTSWVFWPWRRWTTPLRPFSPSPRRPSLCGASFPVVSVSLPWFGLDGLVSWQLWLSLRSAEEWGSLSFSSSLSLSVRPSTGQLQFCGVRVRVHWNQGAWWHQSRDRSAAEVIHNTVEISKGLFSFKVISNCNLFLITQHLCHWQWSRILYLKNTHYDTKSLGMSFFQIFFALLCHIQLMSSCMRSSLHFLFHPSSLDIALTWFS